MKKTYRSPCGIEIKYDEKMQDLILQSLNAFSEDIKQSSLFSGLEFSIPLHTLASLLFIKGINDEGVKRRLLFKVLNSDKKYSEENITDFYEVFSQEIHSYELVENLEYHIFFPVNITEGLFPIGSMLKIKKINLEFYSWEAVTKKYKIDELITKNNLRTGSSVTIQHLTSYCTPIICRVYEKNSHSAFKMAEERVELFRSVLNFFVDDLFKFQFGYPQPLAIIRQSGHYGVFLQNGQLVEPYADFPLPSLNSNLNLRSSSADQITGLITRLNKNDPVANRLINALNLYCSALDATNNSNAYLSLWQCIESLTMLSTSNYSMKDVGSRAQRLMNVQGPVNEYFLRLCSERRNDLVHRGVFNDESQSDVQLLKLVANRCIIRFIKLTEQYKDYKSLEFFYEYSFRSQSEIKAIKKVIDTLIKN